LRNSQQIPPVRHGATAAVPHWPLYSAAFGTRAWSNQSLGSQPLIPPSLLSLDRAVFLAHLPWGGAVKNKSQSQIM
jgi:hypothetical protein